MRRTGKTTRLVDFLVQELFTKGEISVSQFHSDAGEYIDPDSRDNNRAQSYLLRRFIDRLNLEHYGSFETEVKKDHFIFKVKGDV